MDIKHILDIQKTIIIGVMEEGMFNLKDLKDFIKKCEIIIEQYEIDEAE
jgi:hypothetical protein